MEFLREEYYQESKTGMAMDKKDILKMLHAQINVNGHIVGAVAGSGMTAKFAALGGADMLLALSAGKYRIMGRSSFASYLSFGNNNEQVMEMGSRELFPLIKDVPILFGLMASDPMIHLYDYLKEIKKKGFSGIVNFPTVALIDGKFREALEEEGNTYDREVEAIHLAADLGLVTMAFVTNEDETVKMLEAGADIICVHLGLTKGGFLGAKKYVSINDARKITNKIFQVCNEKRPDILKMVYAGPANTPIDMQYLYQNTECQGYVGGSTFDRIPTERAIFNTVRAFKTDGDFRANDPKIRQINGDWNTENIVGYIKEYISEHYMQEIRLGDLALVLHISSSYLSTRFKKETGVSFTEYLVRFRMNKAREFLKNGERCKDAAQNAGYTDYAQFSKMFKKYIGMTPAAYAENPDDYNTQLI